MAHKKRKFDDKYSREFVKKVFKSLFNIELIDGKVYKIDLVCKNDTKIGVEVEHGGWEGNFWVNDRYSWLSNLPFRTINIPIRKLKYWKDDVNGTPNPSATLNIFIRTNKDLSQFIIIRPETIRNPEKAHFTKFLPNNNDTEEEWISFRKEDVETYNLVEGVFVRDIIN